MDDRMMQSLTVAQAVAALRKRWESGKSDFVSIVGLLAEPTIASLMELIEVDAEESLRSGRPVEATAYIQHFPQLELHRDLIEARLLAVASRRSPESSHVSGPVDMFSKNSLAITQAFDTGSSGKSGKSASAPDELSKRLAQREVPFTIGNFLVERFIGEGSFGTVWAGRDKRLDRKVAIKIKHETGDLGLSDDYLHEARSIARLEHPNIVRLLQADETEDGIGYLVYEYVDGVTLDNRINSQDYSTNECVQWIAAIADAIDYAHRRGIIHRDISPRNIMITNTGNARLLDFGLSSIDSGFYVEDSHRILGTPVFMSPEQASGNPHWATSYSDIFSLGSVLYYALTKKLAFAGSSTFDVLERVQKASPASLRSLRSDIPAKLEAVCLRALAKEPQMRYSTGADMSAALINSLSAPVSTVSSKTAATTYPLFAMGALLVVVGVVVSVIGVKELLRPAASSVASIEPAIDNFDLMAVGARQISLFENAKETELLFAKPFQLTVMGDGLTNSRAKIYIFNYREEQGKLTGGWHSLDVEGETTTVQAQELRPGPNMVVVVSSNNPLPDAAEKPSFLSVEPIAYNSPPQDEKSDWSRVNRRVYFSKNRFDLKQKNLSEYVVVLGPGENALSFNNDEFLKALAEKWDNSAIRFNKGDLVEMTYSATAFWINHQPVPSAR